MRFILNFVKIVTIKFRITIFVMIYMQITENRLKWLNLPIKKRNQ